MFECLALTSATSAHHLFEGTQADTMVLFMWQDDMIGVVRIIDACLEMISPEMATKDVMNLSLSHADYGVAMCTLSGGTLTLRCCQQPSGLTGNHLIA